MYGAGVGDNGRRCLDAQKHLRQQPLNCRLLLARLQAFSDVTTQDDETGRIGVAHRHQVQAEPERRATMAVAQYLRPERPALMRRADDFGTTGRIGVCGGQ